MGNLKMFSPQMPLYSSSSKNIKASLNNFNLHKKTYVKIVLFL